ncbi:MAG: hypothetical protein VX077_09045, partial [Pseudomonadota bacterium]|nr:hypothetical protein [Pseudomonadota bacterium]
MTLTGIWQTARVAFLGLALTGLAGLAPAQGLKTSMTYGDARHLLERAGIGAHPAEIETLLGLT